MTAVFVLVGLGLVTLPTVQHRRLEQLAPQEWCRATATSIRAGLAVLQLGLLFGAAPTLLRAVGIHDAADACHRIFGPAAPGGAVTGWLGAGALGYVVHARWRARRHVRHTTEVTTIEPWLGTHQLTDGVDHVTIPSDRPLAYAVPGPSPQIVVSDRLRTSLTPDELAAVLRHETSHLRRGHHRELTLACEVETVFSRWPQMRRSAALLRLAVERVADEDAITTTEDRAHVRDALVKTATSLVIGAVPAFTSAATILHRIAALEAAPHHLLGLVSICFD
ncbi:MAG: M56 family metallopeptidase [Acidimicrobiia bacterium]|nr:M56 family metallopeptidase [Acidimicrobiia bacterium]